MGLRISRCQTYQVGIAGRRRRPKAAAAAAWPEPKATTDGWRHPAEARVRPSSCADETAAAAVAAVAERKGLACWPALQSRPGPSDAVAVRAASRATRRDGPTA